MPTRLPGAPKTLYRSRSAGWSGAAQSARCLPKLRIDGRLLRECRDGNLLGDAEARDPWIHGSIYCAPAPSCVPLEYIEVFYNRERALEGLGHQRSAAPPGSGPTATTSAPSATSLAELRRPSTEIEHSAPGHPINWARVSASRPSVDGGWPWRGCRWWKVAIGRNHTALSPGSR